MAGLKEIFAAKSKIVLVISFVCILYSVSSVVVILLAVILAQTSNNLDLNNDVLVKYAVIAFAWSIFLSIFFVVNALGRRRRRDDKANTPD